MKKLTFALLVLAVVVVACSKNEQAATENQSPKEPVTQTETVPKILGPELISGQAAGEARIGMTLEALQEKYPDHVFEPKPVFEYGIDGEANGLLASRDGKPQFFVWTLDGQETVHGIVILCDRFVTEDGLKVGLTVEQLLEKYPEIEVQRDGLDPNMEFISIGPKKVTLHFTNADGEYVGEYHTDNPEETSRSFALDRQVDRIYVN